MRFFLNNPVLNVDCVFFLRAKSQIKTTKNCFLNVQSITQPFVDYFAKHYPKHTKNSSIYPPSRHLRKRESRALSPNCSLAILDIWHVLHSTKTNRSVCVWVVTIQPLNVEFEVTVSTLYILIFNMPTWSDALIFDNHFLPRMLVKDSWNTNLFRMIWVCH